MLKRFGEDFEYMTISKQKENYHIAIITDDLHELHITKNAVIIERNNELIDII